MNLINLDRTSGESGGVRAYKPHLKDYQTQGESELTNLRL